MNIYCLLVVVHLLLINVILALLFILSFNGPVGQKFPVRQSYLRHLRCVCADEEQTGAICCWQEQTWRVVGEDDMLRWSAEGKEGSKVHKQKSWADGQRSEREVCAQVSDSEKHGKTGSVH